MKRLFVDTSAWDAIADSADPHHELAVLFQAEITGRYRLVITNYVLDELYTLLLINVGYARAVTFKHKLDLLVQHQILQMIWVSEAIAAAAWEVFERFNVDKQWSFTDCVSYVVMKQNEIEEVFAFDHHFEQMGFVRRP